MSTPIRRLVLAATVASASACGDSKEPSMAEALEQADKKEAERKAAEEAKKAAVKVDKKDDPTELPWMIDELKAGLPIGTVVTYRLTGTGADGKPVDDTWTAKVKVNSDDEVGIVQTRESQKDRPQATQVATMPWSRTGPFFSVEKGEPKVTGRETVSVPAGELETSVAEIEGFFGAHLTVYMIVDKPGVYAKVVDHGNTKDEADQTELVYELQSVEMPAE